MGERGGGLFGEFSAATTVGLQVEARLRIGNDRAEPKRAQNRQPGQRSQRGDGVGGARRSLSHAAARDSAHGHGCDRGTSSRPGSPGRKKSNSHEG